MISKQEIKFLKRHETQWGRFGHYVAVFVPAFLFAVGLFNLRLAAMWGAVEGMSLSDVFSHWLQGFDTGQNYSGAYITAVSRISAAALDFAAAFFFVFYLWIDRRQSKLNQKIVKALTKKV